MALEDVVSVFACNFLGHSMISKSILNPLPGLNGILQKLLLIEFLALVLFGIIGALPGGTWITFAGVLTYLAVFIYLYFKEKKPDLLEGHLSEFLSFIQVSMASLLVAACAGSHCSDYLLILSLGLVAFYRNRKTLALATLVLMIEQSLLSVFAPGAIFPADYPGRSMLIVDHLVWLAAAGVILISTCQSEDVVAVEVPLVEKKAKPVPAHAAVTNVPLVLSGNNSIEDLVKVASEVGARAQKLNRSVTNLEGPLRRMVHSINGANRGMQEIKDELSRTAMSVIQITQGSEMHAEKANEVFQAADEAAYGSEIGALSTEQSIHNMQRIRLQMDSIAQRMDNLLSKSQMMVQVVGFADELALQSKVLSVNAAIEAAKAGDRGEGFSAVAREVKSLANQSKDATRQVRQILKEIQKSIAEVRRSIQMGNETVDLASDQCRSTAESIRGLDASVSGSRVAAEQILNSSKDQVAGIMQISHAMNDIQSVSEQNSGSLSNLQVEAQKLNTIARDLVADMGSYQALVDQLMTQCASLNQMQEPGG